MPRRRKPRPRRARAVDEPLWPVLLGLSAVLLAIGFIAHLLVERHNEELMERQHRMELHDRADSIAPAPGIPPAAPPR